MEIGKRIRLFREQLGLSQKDLADLIFIGEGTIGHYETGTRMPPVDKLELISNALDVDITDLMYDIKKTDDDWFDYFYKDTKKAKKNMDEQRFRLMLDRMFSEFDTIEETEEDIMIEGYVYSKSLANKLLPLANDMVNFNMMCRFPNDNWLINGFVGDEPFEFEIRHYRTRAKLDVTTEIEKKIPQEMKEIVKLFKTWFEESNPDIWLQCSFEAELYLSDNNYTKILNERIPLYILSMHRLKAFGDNRELEKKFWRVRGLLQTSHEEVASIPDISEVEMEIIEEFKERMKRIIEG